LSARAAEVFAGAEPHEQTEQIYHLLVAEPSEETSQKLKDLWERWDQSGRHEYRKMLASTLGELLQSVPLEAVARARVLLVHGFAQNGYVPARQIEESARSSVAIFEGLHDAASEADARSLLGDALVLQGRREEALREYQEDKRIMLELTRRDPGNADWLRDLSVSHCQLGSLLADSPEHLQAAISEHRKSVEIAEPSSNSTGRDRNGVRTFRSIGNGSIHSNSDWQTSQRNRQVPNEYPPKVPVTTDEEKS
jgi:hypothetical protein